MRGVDGQWALEVRADGTDLGLTLDRLVDVEGTGSFSVINNIHQHLPSVYVNFKDDTGSALDRPFPEGTALEVSYGLPTDLYRGQRFASVGAPKIGVGASYNTLGVNGFLDKMNFMRKVVDRNYKGTSSDVISELASLVGLKADVDPTNDYMNWLPNRTTLSQYANHITDRAWASPTSAMMLVVTDTGKLRFKNLDTLIQNGPAKTLTSFASQTGDLQILTWNAEPKSVVTNNTYGYGSTSIGMKEDGTMFEGNTVEMTLMSSVTSIAKRFQDEIGTLGGRISVLPPLAGNTHEKWNDALHQNPRIKSSYAFDVSVVIDRPSHLELLDVVKLVPNNTGSGRVAKAMVGNYIVTASTKFFLNNRYFEKLVVTAQGAGGV